MVPATSMELSFPLAVCPPWQYAAYDTFYTVKVMLEFDMVYERVAIDINFNMHSCMEGNCITDTFVKIFRSMHPKAS